MFSIIDHTLTPTAPAQPAPAAPSRHGGPPMPWTVREAEAYGGKLIRFKAYPNGMTGDLLIGDDEAIVARVAYLEDLITALKAENEALRAELAAAGTTVLSVVTPPTDGIEAAVEIETERPETPGEHAALVNELYAQLTVPTAPVSDTPDVGTVGTGPQVPSGFVALAPELEPAVATPEPLTVTTGPTPAPEVGAPSDVPPVGTEPSAPKSARRVAVEGALKEFPHLSNAVLAERCGVSAEFVRQVRKQLEAVGLLEPQTSVVGRDGLEQSVATKTGAEAA